MDENKLLLPWYINGTLSQNDRDSVEFWVQEDPKAQAYLQTTQRISQAAIEQEDHIPSSNVRFRLLSQISEHPLTTKNNPFSWFWSVPVMILIFSLLWIIAQPGTQLKWSTNGNGPGSFRVYRAAEGSGEFVLIEELPATTSQQTYHYADVLVVPGQTYKYLIEVRDHNGNTATSQILTSNSQLSLIAQLSIFLTSLILAIGIITLSREIEISRSLNLII